MTEIFRHLRPHWADQADNRLVPAHNGGISYLLRLTSQGAYDYWVYICPTTAGFSAKQAIKTLRQVANNGTKPWGSITLDGRPLLDQLIEATITTTDLPSELNRHAQTINHLNTVAKRQLLDHA